MDFSLKAASALLGVVAWAAVTVAVEAQAPSTQQPIPAAAKQEADFSTTKVEGTDNVYLYRYRGHQSMFVVTPDGVIATDPQGYLLPDAGPTYLREIRKITQAPVRYVIYSHLHFDHIAGGQVFKDAGAVFVAHRRAKERLEQLQRPDVVMPDLVVDDQAVITLGGTQIELSYVGRNHSDSMLVMRLPKEKLLFAVDWIPIGQALPETQCLTFFCVPTMGDDYLGEYEDGLRRVLAMDWDRLLPGHPSPRFGTKQDVRNLLEYMEDVGAATRKAALQGRCNEPGQKTITLSKAYPWAAPNKVTDNIWRYCLYWSQGY